MTLTEFEVFAGTLPYRQIQGLFARLGVPWLVGLTQQLSQEPDPVRALLTRLLCLPRPQRRGLVAEVLAACHRHPERDPALAAAVAASLTHPQDIGPVILLTMRHRVLPPGTFMYIPPGVLHAYVHGTAVEIQANTDNVARAALTGKPVNTPELLRIVHTDQQPHLQNAVRRGRTHSWLVHNQTYFSLHQVAGGTTETVLPAPGAPRVALALRGPVRLHSGDRTLRLQPGQCCFLPASQDPVSVTGPGDVYLAGPGQPSDMDVHPGDPVAGQLVAGVFP